MSMIYGTHNSATGGKLVWWLRPIGGIINLTSKCQDRTIAQQLADGVKVFNLQVAKVNGKWRFTHGLAVYEEDVLDTLKLMRLCASVKEPIYFQLYLDKCFWCKQDETKFLELIAQIRNEFLDDKLMMFDPWVEGTKELLRMGTVFFKKISLEEHYWTLNWVKVNKPMCFSDWLPLPKYHAKKYNAQYKKECMEEYLMLDYYNI